MQEQSQKREIYDGDLPEFYRTLKLAKLTRLPTRVGPRLIRFPPVATGVGRGCFEGKNRGSRLADGSEWEIVADLDLTATIQHEALADDFCYEVLATRATAVSADDIHERVKHLMTLTTYSIKNPHPMGRQQI